MGRINIEVPDDLHQNLKYESIERNQTLKATVIEILDDGVEEQPKN